jgi:hypothetical protein
MPDKVFTEAIAQHLWNTIANLATETGFAIARDLFAQAYRPGLKGCTVFPATPAGSACP